MISSCSYTNLIDIRPDNVIECQNCTYTYNNGVYHIIKIDSDSNVSLYFNLIFDSDTITNFTFNTSIAICNSSYAPSLRYYNGNSQWGSVNSSYLNGNRVGQSNVSLSLYHNTKIQLFFMNTPSEFDVDLSKFFIQSGDSFTGFETYNCESLVPVVPEPTINGIHLYSMIEDNFITDNYYLNCGILIIFFSLIIILFNIPFYIIRKCRRY